MTIQSENFKRAPQRVVAAAIRNHFGDIIVSARHYDNRMHAQVEASTKQWDITKGPVAQGFIDQFGMFLTREEAWVIAERNGQIIRRVGGDGVRLYSENLY